MRLKTIVYSWFILALILSITVLLVRSEVFAEEVVINENYSAIGASQNIIFRPHKLHNNNSVEILINGETFSLEQGNSIRIGQMKVRTDVTKHTLVSGERGPVLFVTVWEYKDISANEKIRTSIKVADFLYEYLPTSGEIVGMIFLKFLFPGIGIFIDPNVVLLIQSAIDIIIPIIVVKMES